MPLLLVLSVCRWVGGWVQVVLDKLTASLARVCKNPSNPLFNHYLFEALASLVNAVCRSNPNATSDFEALLMPPFETVLSMDVVRPSFPSHQRPLGHAANTTLHLPLLLSTLQAEFTPYVFQILAQLLLYRPNGMSPAFSRLFGPILSASVWERKSNVPGAAVLPHRCHSSLSAVFSPFFPAKPIVIQLPHAMLWLHVQA